MAPCVNPGHRLNPPFSFTAMCPRATSPGRSQDSTAAFHSWSGVTPLSFTLWHTNAISSKSQFIRFHFVPSHAWSHLIVLHDAFINLRTIKCASFEGRKSICILSVHLCMPVQVLSHLRALFASSPLRSLHTLVRSPSPFCS